MPRVLTKAAAQTTAQAPPLLQCCVQPTASRDQQPQWQWQGQRQGQQLVPPPLRAW